REVSALTDARKTLAYDFFRILRAPLDGINGPVDFNVFNGTEEELQAFVDGIKETP
ncbi:hypothetical protein AB7Y24_11155, partial [Escherichia coli]